MWLKDGAVRSFGMRPGWPQVRLHKSGGDGVRDCPLDWRRLLIFVECFEASLHARGCLCAC
jgi:hypothetical protein